MSRATPLHGVHWKLSARAGELITKVHVDDEHLGAVVLADLRSLGVHASPEALERGNAGSPPCPG